jgi:hypothetical protein
VLLHWLLYSHGFRTEASGAFVGIDQARYGRVLKGLRISSASLALGSLIRGTAARCLVLLIATTCASGFAADRTFNISYVAEASNPYVNGLPTACSPAVATSCVYGDIWAENGYVYVGTDVDNGGVNVFSVANPASPQFLRNPTNLTGTITKPTYVGNQFEDVEVWDGIGYFGSDTNTTSGTGVDIVDLSIPFDPILLSRVNSSIGGHNKVHTLSVNNGYLYTTDNNVNDYNAADFVKVFDVHDPSNPSLVASVPITITTTVANPLAIASHEVIVRDNRMYVASKNNGSNTCCGWIHIFDVSNPASPVLLKAFVAGARTHTALPSADGKLLIVAEERPDGNVKIYDISNINSPNDPDTPILLSTINRTSAGIDATSPHHPHLHGNLLFLPWYEAGLQVFNITNPASPVHVGSFDTYTGTSPSNSYAGDWGVDLSMGLNRVFLSDRNRGLIVVDASGVLAQGDYDQNMIVNDLDYTAWRSTYGNGSSGLHVGAFADGNYNNVVDAADYVLWRKNVGHTGPVGQGSGEFTITTFVPEPGSMALLLTVIGLASTYRRAR